MKAQIHWSNGEPPTTCEASVRGPGQGRASMFILRFERRWLRLWKREGEGDALEYYIRLGNARERVTFVQADRPTPALASLPTPANDVSAMIGGAGE